MKQAPDSPAALPLGPELTIAFAAAWHEALVDAVGANAGELTLDLRGVTDFDSAGVQLLLATQRSLAAQGRALRLLDPSAAVRDGLQVFGLQSLLAARHATH
jgi:anti-anti-sigma factor